MIKVKPRKLKGFFASSKFSKIKDRIPVTRRSIGLSAISIYFVFGPARGSLDIIATYLGYGLLFLVGYTTLIGYISANLVRRSLKVQFVPQFSSSGRYTSRDEITFASSIKTTWLLPFFNLTISPKWVNGDYSQVAPQIRDILPGIYNSKFKGSFPHRGNWNAEEFQGEYLDILGLFCFKWRQALEHPISLPIYPSELPELDLPITSFLRKEGDVELSHDAIEGEHYDLKRYDPSDGIRRIVWKIFARTGELVSRHPELTTQPEGKAVIFAVADREEDYVAARAHQYAARAEMIGMEIRGGCLGMRKSLPATNSGELLALLLKSVWDSEISNLKRDIQQLAASVADEQKGSFGEKIAIFIGKEKGSRHISSDQLTEICGTLNTLGIQPVWYVVDRAQSSQLEVYEHSLHSQDKGSEPELQERIRNYLKWWFLTEHRFEGRDDGDTSIFKELLAITDRFGGHVISA